MEEENKEEELKSEEQQPEPAETIEEAKAEEEIEESSKGEAVVEEAAETEAKEAPAPVEEEEAKPLPPEEKPEEKPEEEEIVEERIYTIPLGKAWIMPPNKRTPKAMRIIRAFVTKHMKLEAKKEEEEEEAPKRLIISNEVNERLWKRGIEKPSRKIRIRAAKDKEGNVTVYLAEGD